MYWNLLEQLERKNAKGWIVTLDVLKWDGICSYNCTSTCWIVTLDVLKLKHLGQDTRDYLLNSNIRCIEIRHLL